MNIREVMKPGHDLTAPSEVPPGRRDQWCRLARNLGVKPGQEERYRDLVNGALCAEVEMQSGIEAAADLFPR